MGQENGQSYKKGRKPGPGRPKGLANKTTQDARAAIAAFVDNNAHRLTGWLDSVAEGDPGNDVKPNPGRAFELLQSVVEYHIPKLARVEQRGPNEDGSHTFNIGLPWLKDSIAKRNG